MRCLAYTRCLVLLILAAAAAACDAPADEQFRLVTVESQDRLGLSLRELPEATLKSIGLGYGLAVIRLGKEGERAGLRLGDVVYGVNQTRIRSLQEFSGALAQLQGRRLSLLVRRGKTDLQVPLELGVLPSEDGILRMPRPAKDTLLRT
jgi:membrane-associated protease RseP (regulator of RpoE activity)